MTRMSFLRLWQLLTSRSAFLAAVLVGTVACSVPAYAQKGKIYRVAFVAAISPVSELQGTDPINPAARTFVRRLRELGYAEGRNLIMDFRTLEGRNERIPEILADIVRFKPDVIFTGTQQVVMGRNIQATAGIPVVTLASWSFVDQGIVQSLARPGGTVTGFIADVDSGVETKRLELLRETIPGVKRVAYLGVPLLWDSPAGKGVQDAAQRLGLSLFHALYTGADVQAASVVIDREAPQAIFVAGGSTSYGNRQRIVQLASAKRLPCFAGFREFAESGCLMSYGADNDEIVRGAAGYVAKILEGTKPGDLPIQQPSKFELTINMKTAKALGLRIPQSILQRADRVIE